MNDPPVCPVPGCAARIDRQHLMCRPHWALVPRALQQQVWTAWRAVKNFRASADLLTAIPAYRQAAADAIEAAREKELAGLP